MFIARRHSLISAPNFSKANTRWSDAEANLKKRKESAQRTLERNYQRDLALLESKEEEEEAAEQAKSREELQKNFEADKKAADDRYEADCKELQEARAFEFRRIGRYIENLQTQKDVIEQRDPFNQLVGQEAASGRTSLPRLGRR